MTLTPEQKLHKQQKANLLTTVNRLKSQFSFGNIKTWNDVYRIVGYSSEYIQKNYNEKVDKPVTITDLRSFIDKLNKDLEELQNRKVEDERTKLDIQSKGNTERSISISQEDDKEGSKETDEVLPIYRIPATSLGYIPPEQFIGQTQPNSDI